MVSDVPNPVVAVLFGIFHHSCNSPNICLKLVKNATVVRFEVSEISASCPLIYQQAPFPNIMLFFETDLSKLQEGESKVVDKNVNETPYLLYMSRKLGSIPIPIGCTAISTPVRLAALDDYWFAALFEMHQTIEQVDFLKLYSCMAGFLPLFVERRIVFPVSLRCFHDGTCYKLALPRCILKYEATDDEIKDFRAKLAGLFPPNSRACYAIVHARDLGRLPKHPVCFFSATRKWLNSSGVTFR